MEFLPKGWWSFDLPGYREAPEPATYALFAYEKLPPLKDPGNNFAWLTAVPAREASIASDAEPFVTRFGDLMPHIVALLPDPFRAFTRNRNLQMRIRSCTDCFLEAPDYFIRTASPLDGWLVHFLSDSQWVLHWYLHLRPDGSHFVLVSPEAWGFKDEEEPPWDWENFTVDLAERQAWFCAPTFSEFIYRFWLENEIWFALEEKKRLTAAQKKYLEHYKK